MKIKILVIACLVSALGAFVGCNQTPQQAVATGIYASGYAAASDILSKDSSLAPTIQDVAAKLPLLNTNKLTPRDLGVLAGELRQLSGNVEIVRNFVPADSTKLDRANAFLAGVISSNAALNGGRAPTADQVLATTALTDFANGLTDGIEFWKGRDSVGQVPTAGIKAGP